VVVAGVGHPDRGDDGVGPLVVRAVQDALGGHPTPSSAFVLVAPHVDPVDLPDLWEGAARVVLVDAVRSGGPPGAVAVRDLVSGAVAAAGAHPQGSGTHGLGIAHMVELSRAMGTLPPQVLLVGIEADRWAPGEGLSAAVGEAVHRAVERVLELVDEDLAQTARVWPGSRPPE
jgi:hydrogenase maturation protease